MLSVAITERKEFRGLRFFVVDIFKLGRLWYSGRAARRPRSCLLMFVWSLEYRMDLEFLIFMGENWDLGLENLLFA